MSIIHILTDYVLPFLPILTLVVFVHELGHYWVARRNGVGVQAFSIGFGPELFGWTDRRGTRWKVSAIPLGGYVKMVGDMDPASAGQVDAGDLSPEDRARSFHLKRVDQRAAVVAAGPIANFIFSILLLGGLYATVGQPFTAPTVDTVEKGSAAEAAGFQRGDRVVSIDGSAIERFQDMQRIVQGRPGEALSVLVLRDGRELTLTATPELAERKDNFGRELRFGKLGIQSRQTEVVRHDPLTAIYRAGAEIWNLSIMTLGAIGQIVTGARSTDEIGGVLSIAHMSGEVARAGLVSTVTFIALLSVNLGVINLFPIPVLDGGHLMFYAAEAVRGRPIGKRVQEYGSMAGLAAVLALMIFATWNDLVHLRVVAFFASLIS